MGMCEDAIAEILGLTETDRKMLLLLCKKPRSVGEMASILKKTPPRIQQRVGSLLYRGMVSRKKEGLARGYRYVYHAAPKRALIEIARKELETRNKRLCAMLKG